MNDKLTFVNPEGYLPPKGYSNGALVSGPTLFVAGQVGWNAQCEFETDDLAEQFAQALDNVLAVVRAAGGGPTDLAKMTVYVTDLDAYRGSRKAIGQAWRARLGKHFPAMALLGVAGLVEKRAKVEIEAVAVLRGATDPA
ncbi:RidA family protein [Polyangium mundeleinium]|uniref:RidA family protein n=1 Tax=Polyangium mundeleinium TaxID=2995306 RepID=A0ABT5EZK1_9BACT|nr:RidA family protein [Polyangium mundeleinium]MDC0747274.1 RidA family protein [Polyangium mundeleinium]